MACEHTMLPRTVALLAFLASGIAMPLTANDVSPPANGLELWYDAAHEATERGISDGSVTAPPLPLDAWHDRSNHQRDIQQPELKDQPVLRRITMPNGQPGPWVVRFDGLDDHLRLPHLNERYDDMTLVIVTAPYRNGGNFRGLFAFGQHDKRDYETGFNLDQSASFTSKFNVLNVEGRGFGGANDLMTSEFPFGTLHFIEVRVDSQNRQVTVTVDGKREGERPCSTETRIADNLVVGARFYSNDSPVQRAQGFHDGDIAELLLYRRALSDDELKTLRDQLAIKHAALVDELPREFAATQSRDNAETLVVVDDPPPVQMLVPGFSVQEVPIELNNINNLRYRPDGKLYALGYDGNIWLLSDTDSNGLLETKSAFFENHGRLRGPIGMAVIPPGHPLLQANTTAEPNTNASQARGVVVAAKGKVSAIVDYDGDEIAETERVIAEGWQEIPQNVDAVGVAIHPRDGSIYFALGTAAYNNAYLIDDQGQSKFDLSSERGTVQRIAADLSARTTICTGVRFPIGMEFAHDGELFLTDQEGATWLPNGNPFDELLHIRAGRHYGFPPRHPRHLPQVFDEPSLFDYGPQHQSTCGMAFNLPVTENGPTFGPDAWRGDLIVTGESRGKLYRTRIVRTGEGEFIASNQLIGCLPMLTVDCCITPQGDLLVACHSGGPDWGTGPTGQGKIFRIRYEGKQFAQPTRTWAAGPHEVRVAFDRPLEPDQLRDLLKNTRISYGQYVAAGDRFETIRPGYAVTDLQQSRPRFPLPIHAIGVTPDRTTLVLSTDRHTAAVDYAISLPGMGRELVTGNDRQHPQIDLAYSLAGVQVEWKPSDTTEAPQSGWIAHPDIDLTRQLLGDTLDQQALLEAIAKPGKLRLSTQLDTHGLFLPATQPISELDYVPQDDKWVARRQLLWTSDRPFSIVHVGGGEKLLSRAVDTGHELTMDIPADSARWINIEIETTTAAIPLSLHVKWVATMADGMQRSGPLALRRWIVPWGQEDVISESSTDIRRIPELAGGSWGRGRQLFLNNELGCVKCHTASTIEGGKIGPDLSNLIHRDYQSVVRDILQPSHAINPDFITYAVARRDGQVLSGTVRSDGDSIVLGNNEGKESRLPRADIESIEAVAVSTMPLGMFDKLTDAQRTDMLAFLLSAPPRMPLSGAMPPPPPRTRAEISAALSGAQPVDAPQPIQLLLVAGEKDHGPDEHDYPAWLTMWSQLMEGADKVTVDTAMDWPTDAQITRADTIVFFQKGEWNASRARSVDQHLRAGRGLVYIHWAIEGGSEAPQFAQRIGLAGDMLKTQYRHGPLELLFQSPHDNPIGRNLERLHLHDESYWNLQGRTSMIRSIATAEEQGEARPQFWTVEQGKGRIFVSIPGHYSWTFDDPIYRLLLLRGIAWSAHQPVDRWNELTTLGLPVR